MNKPKFNIGDYVLYDDTDDREECVVKNRDYVVHWSDFGDGPSSAPHAKWFYELAKTNGEHLVICTERGPCWVILPSRKYDFKPKKWIKPLQTCN